MSANKRNSVSKLDIDSENSGNIIKDNANNSSTTNGNNRGNANRNKSYKSGNSKQSRLTPNKNLRMFPKSIDVNITRGGIIDEITRTMGSAINQSLSTAQGNLYSANLMQFSTTINVTDSYQQNQTEFLDHESFPFEYEQMVEALYDSESENTSRETFNASHLYRYTYVLARIWASLAFFNKLLSAKENKISEINPLMVQQFTQIIDTGEGEINNDATDEKYADWNLAHFPIQFGDKHALRVKLDELVALVSEYPDATGYSQFFANLFGSYFKDADIEHAALYSFQPDLMGKCFTIDEGGTISLTNVPGVSATTVSAWLDELEKFIGNLKNSKRIRALTKAMKNKLKCNFPKLPKPIVYNKRILNAINNATIGYGYLAYTDPNPAGDNDITLPNRVCFSGPFANVGITPTTSAQYVRNKSQVFNFDSDNVKSDDIDNAGLFRTVWFPDGSDILEKYIPPVAITTAAIAYSSWNGSPVFIKFNGTNILEHIQTIDLDGFADNLTGIGVTVSVKDNLDLVNQIRSFVNMQSLVAQFDYHPMCIQGIISAVACKDHKQENLSGYTAYWDNADPNPLLSIPEGYDVISSGNSEFTTVQWMANNLSSLSQKDSVQLARNNHVKILQCASSVFGNNN